MKRWKKLCIWASTATAICSLGLGGVAYSLNFTPITEDRIWITCSTSQNHIMAANKVANDFQATFTLHFQGIHPNPKDFEWSIESQLGETPSWLYLFDLDTPKEGEISYRKGIAWDEGVSTGQWSFKIVVESKTLGLVYSTPVYTLDVSGDYKFNSMMNTTLSGFTGNDSILSNPIMVSTVESGGRMPLDALKWQIKMVDDQGNIMPGVEVPHWLWLDISELSGGNSEAVRVHANGEQTLKDGTVISHDSSPEDAGTYRFVVNVVCNDEKVAILDYTTEVCEITLTAQHTIPEELQSSILDIRDEVVSEKEEKKFYGIKNNVDWTQPDLVDVNTIIVPDDVTIFNSISNFPEQIKSIVFDRKNSKCWRIGDDVFKKNNNIVNIDLPNSLVNIGNEAFQFVSSIKTLEFGTEFESFGFRCYDRGNINTLTFDGDGGKINVGNWCFSGCGGLSTIIFKKLDTLPKFGGACFNGVGVGRVIIESGIYSQDEEKKQQVLAALYANDSRLPTGWKVF